MSWNTGRRYYDFRKASGSANPYGASEGPHDFGGMSSKLCGAPL